jgi:hypothetical protein
LIIGAVGIASRLAVAGGANYNWIFHPVGLWAENSIVALTVKVKGQRIERISVFAKEPLQISCFKYVLARIGRPSANPTRSFFVLHCH